MPCQVPSKSLPPSTQTVWLVPVKIAFMCESAICLGERHTLIDGKRRGRVGNVEVAQAASLFRLAHNLFDLQRDVDQLRAPGRLDLQRFHSR